MDELNQNDNLVNEEEMPKKKSKLEMILGIIGVVVVLGIVILLICVFSSVKYKYFGLVGNKFATLTSYVEDFEEGVFGRILNTNFNNKLTINTEVNAKVETEDKEISAWLNGFNSVKLIANENSDIKNNYFDSDIKIALNGEDFILANLLRKDDIFSANVDKITDGYISADNTKISELWQKIGYEGPEKFTSQVEFIEGFKFSRSEKTELYKALLRVGHAFTKAFGKEDFSEGKETITYNTKSIDAKYIDFKMNSVEMNNGVIRALEQLLKEDKAIDVLLKLSNAYDNMYIQAGYDVKPFTRDEFVDAIEYILEEVKKLEFSEDDGMIIRLYYEGNSIVKAEVFNMNYTSSVLKLVMIDDGREKYYEYDNGLMNYVDNVYMAEKDIWTHTIDVNYINYETGEFLEDYSDTIVLTLNSAQKNNTKLVMTSDNGNFEYVLEGIIDGNKKNVNYSMIASDETSTNNINIKVEIAEKTEFEEKSVENSFDTSTATDEEINAKKEQVLKNWNDFSSKNENKISQLYTALSIYVGSMTQMDGDYTANE